MAKRKFKQGAQVISVAELLEHEWFIVHFGPNVVKTLHKDFIASWQLHTCELFVDAGWVYIAEQLTNGEFYAGKTEEWIRDKLGEDICELYCPLPAGSRGTHFCYGELTTCGGSHCGEAIEAWKKKYVE